MPGRLARPCSCNWPTSAVRAARASPSPWMTSCHSGSASTTFCQARSKTSKPFAGTSRPMASTVFCMRGAGSAGIGNGNGFGRQTTSLRGRSASSQRRRSRSVSTTTCRQNCAASRRATLRAGLPRSSSKWQCSHAIWCRPRPRVAGSTKSSSMVSTCTSTSMRCAVQCLRMPATVAK
ncbi:hypothetical protein D3C72_1742300 [compost metagenome]